MLGVDSAWSCLRINVSGNRLEKVRGPEGKCKNKLKILIGEVDVEMDREGRMGESADTDTQHSSLTSHRYWDGAVGPRARSRW